MKAIEYYKVQYLADNGQWVDSAIWYSIDAAREACKLSLAWPRKRVVACTAKLNSEVITTTTLFEVNHEPEEKIEAPETTREYVE